MRAASTWSPWAAENTRSVEHERSGETYPCAARRGHSWSSLRMERHSPVIDQRLDHDPIAQRNAVVLGDERRRAPVSRTCSRHLLRPSLVLASICAPFSSSNLTRLSLPHFDATCKGVMFCCKRTMNAQSRITNDLCKQLSARLHPTRGRRSSSAFEDSFVLTLAA